MSELTKIAKGGISPHYQAKSVSKASDSEADQQSVLLRDITRVADMSRSSAFTARQLATFLLVYTSSESCTVRGIAKELDISKAAVSRILNGLCAARLVVRRPDPRDGRSVIVGHTASGMQFLAELRATLASTRPAPARLRSLLAGLGASL